jgi:hypothetical protein
MVVASFHKIVYPSDGIRRVRLFLLPCGTSYKQGCQLKGLSYRALLDGSRQLLLYAQLVKFTSFYGSQGFTAVFTKARHRPRLFQSTCCNIILPSTLWSSYQNLVPVRSYGTFHALPAPRTSKIIAQITNH